MSELTLIERARSAPRLSATASVEEKLEWLRAFGEPGMHFAKGIQGGTWNCRVDLNTNIPGADFKARGEYLPTVRLAVDSCIENLMTIFQQMGARP